jgi:cysteine synthase B
LPTKITGKHIIKLQVQRFGMTRSTVTHFVAAMGTTGTIMGTSTYLKEKNPAIRLLGPTSEWFANSGYP